MKHPETPLNPKLLSVMQEMKAVGLGPVDVMRVDLSYARSELEKQYAYLNEDPIPVSQVQTLKIQFEDESINVRLYLPDSPCDSSTFGIYLHGGGWTFGNEQTHDGIARAFCKSSQLPVASVLKSPSISVVCSSELKKLNKIKVTMSKNFFMWSILLFGV
jgi:acetyl esterase